MVEEQLDADVLEVVDVLVVAGGPLSFFREKTHPKKARPSIIAIYILLSGKPTVATIDVMSANTDMQAEDG